MPKLPITSGSKIIKTLSKLRWKAVRQKGDHVIMEGTTSKGRTIVPVPLYKEIDRELLSKILKETEVKVKEFLKYLFIFFFRR